jgi:hypothetical protein
MHAAISCLKTAKPRADFIERAIVNTFGQQAFRAQFGDRHSVCNDKRRAMDDEPRGSSSITQSIFD